MLKLSQIAQSLQVNVNKVASDLVVKGRGRFFIYYDNSFFAFPSVKRVTVPFDFAQLYAKTIHNKQLEKPKTLKDLKIPPVSSGNLEKIRVAVLLGHFNHGKTTLLDCLINTTNSAAKSDLVSEEKHGITQVKSSLFHFSFNISSGSEN
jgi:polynucleotide 5'-kinase involved in rRNA processing